MSPPVRLVSVCFGVCIAMGLFSAMATAVQAESIVQFNLDIANSPSNFQVELYDTQVPITVNNFLNYVSSHAYDNSIIHRSLPGFVIQGGGYTLVGNGGVVAGLPAIATNPPIQNEFDPARSNVRGTIAMAKVSGDPNSATSQWFFNLADNSKILDNQDGGFTVFGQVIGNGMAAIDAIAALATYDFGAPFDSLPLGNYDGYFSNNPPVVSNFVTVISISPVPEPSTFALLGAGAVGLAAYAWRRWRQATRVALP